jgi:hypothetical protein
LLLCPSGAWANLSGYGTARYWMSFHGGFPFHDDYCRQQDSRFGRKGLFQLQRRLDLPEQVPWERSNKS